LYRKYNRARIGDLKEGNTAIDTKVTTMDGMLGSLLSVARVLNDGNRESDDCHSPKRKKILSDEARPIVLIGGSYS